MRYLAILGYDCGCVHENNYGFVKTIRFSAENKNGLEGRVKKLRERLPRKEEGHQCFRRRPREIVVVDESFNVVRKYRRE